MNNLSAAYFFHSEFLARGGENACDIKGWKGLMAGHHVSCADIEILSTMRERIFLFFFLMINNYRDRGVK